MSAEREVELQFLVTPACGDTLPDVHSLGRYFRDYSHWKARVRRSPEGECLVSVRLLPYIFSDQRGSAFSDVLYPVQEKHHIVDGHRIEVDLVVPDVCGSKAVISQGRVEVSIDPEVINKVTADQQWQDDFLKRLKTCSPHSASVEFRDNGDIVVTRLSTRDTPVQRQWELFIVFSLGQSLSPFQTSLSTGQLSVRDSCIKRSAVQASSSCDCHTNVMIDLREMQYATLVKGKILGNLRTRFPGLRLTHFDHHLILSGRGDSPKTARMYVLDYAKYLSIARIPLTDTQAMMMEKKDAKKWFEDVDCVWELNQASTKDKHDSGHIARSSEKSVVSVIARDSDIQTFKQVMLSCFQTSELLLSKNQVPHSLSDTWSQFLANLEKPGGERAPPVVKVQKDKISICDASSTIESTRRAIHDFFHRLEPVPKETCDLRATESINKLQPWQVLFLTTARLEKRLPGPLQQALTVDCEMQTVSIHAPFHQLDRRVCDFWNYVVDLSQEVMPLTAASMEVLQKPVGKERVQRLLDQKGIVCNWETAEGGLVVCAQRSHMQQLQRIFNETIQQDLQSNIRHEDKELQAGESRVGNADKRQQAGIQHHRSSEKKTDDNKGVGRQVRGEDRPAEKDDQKEREKETPKSKETQTFATHDPNQKQPTTEPTAQPEVKQTQNTRLMLTQLQMDENSNNRAHNSGPATVARETTLTSLQKKDREKERPARTTETQTAWEHKQTAVERDDVDNDLSHRDVQGRTGLKSPRTFHQALPGWTGDSPSATGHRDHPEPQDATESNSLTHLKSIARSQENRATGTTATDMSTGDLYPHQPLPVLTSTGQPRPDPVSVGERGHLRQLPQCSFPERSPTARAANDVTTQTSADSDISEPVPRGQETSSTRQGTRGRLVRDSNSRSGFPVPAPALQRTVSACDRTTQQPEHARELPTRAASAPGVSERCVESVRNQTVHPPPAARPLEQSQHFWNASPRNARSAAEGQGPDDITEMHECDDRPSAEGSTDPPYPQHQGHCHERGQNREPFSNSVETPHDESATGSFSGQARYRGHSASSQQASTTTAAATNHSNNDSVQQQLNSAMHARLSQLELRVSQMDRGSIQEWMVHLETRMINMMQEMTEQRQSDLGSEIMLVNNPSEAQSLDSFLTESQSSLSGLLSELQQLQQQHQEQSQHSHPQQQQQHEQQQQQQQQQQLQQHHHQLQQWQRPQQQHHEPQQQQQQQPQQQRQQLQQQQQQQQRQQQHHHSLQQQQHEQHQRQQPQPQQHHHQQVRQQQQKYQLQQQEQQQRQLQQQQQQGQQQQQHEQKQHQQQERQQWLEQCHRLQQQQPQEMNYSHDVVLIIFFAFLLYLWKEYLGPSQ